MATTPVALIRRASGHNGNLWRDVPLLALGVVTALGAAGIGGGSVRLVFAATALIVGIVYYRSSPQRYVFFALSTWFFCPMLRRLVDMHLGYDPHSVMSLTPLSVSGIAAAGVLRRLPTLLRRSRAPFLLIGAALLYGLFMGLVRNGPEAALYTLGAWLVPVLFGLDIALRSRQYREIRKAFVRFGPLAVLVTGVYGVIQWVHPWAWDRLWMIDAPSGVAFGAPEQYAIRVFSTLNGPAPFGLAMGAALLLLLVRPRPTHAVAGVAGGLAFLLSLCRTAWIAWVVALIAFALSLRGRARLRILVAGVGLTLAVIGVVVIAPLAPAGRFTDLIAQRAASIGDPMGDVSLTARESSVAGYVDAILDRPEGYGLGSTGLGTGLAGADQGSAVRDFDNGLLEAFYSLGLIGGLCWILGLAWLVLLHAWRRFPSDDRFANVARAIVWFCLAAYGSTNSAAGVGGIFLWSGIGLCAAARDWMARATSRPPSFHATGPAQRPALATRSATELRADPP